MYVDNDFRYEDLKIENNELIAKGVYTCWTVEEDKIQKGMFWIITDDGNKSADFYNLSRARENMKLMYLRQANSDCPEGPTTGSGAI